jgi:hypothetical protein
MIACGGLPPRNHLPEHFRTGHGTQSRIFSPFALRNIFETAEAYVIAGLPNSPAPLEPRIPSWEAGKTVAGDSPVQPEVG